jgi:hypothetical protein
LRSRVVIEAKPHLSFLLGNFSRQPSKLYPIDS